MKPLRQIKLRHWMLRSIYPVVSAIVVLVAISGSHRSETPALDDKKESVAENMRGFSQQIIATYERRDTKTLKSFYAKQPQALFFWERKMSYSWDQLDNTMDALVSAVVKLKLATREFRSGGAGNNGWFAATFHALRITPEGKEISSAGRWTVVAEKVNERWLIVHEHTSFPLPEP
ncbi:hypothetical protein BH18ACI4_BH18ACI4_00230 [soil metagenome]